MDNIGSFELELRMGFIVTGEVGSPSVSRRLYNVGAGPVILYTYTYRHVTTPKPEHAINISKRGAVRDRIKFYSTFLTSTFFFVVGCK